MMGHLFFYSRNTQYHFSITLFQKKNDTKFKIYGKIKSHISFQSTKDGKRRLTNAGHYATIKVFRTVIFQREQVLN